MGVWGVGIYSNDTAEDVRDACKDLFSYYDLEKGNEKIMEHFRELLDQEWIDNEQASFWYALSDWQWKHGMLTESVKEKALELLTGYAGLSEWEESGSARDVMKRKKVLDSLREQLQTPQPPLKKPRLHLAKPKHKTGDILIFQATDYRDEWDSAWKIRNIRPPYIFQSTMIANSAFENLNGYDAHGKYMAILCVGSQKEPYSEYLPFVFDEYSVYVWYNYLSDTRPSVAQLTSCGFLPMIRWTMKDWILNITEDISWVYRFTLTAESFHSDSYLHFETKESKNKEESDRFYSLLARKKYSSDYVVGFALTNMFYTAFQEAYRMDSLQLKVDDLLNPDVINPELLSPSEIDAISKKQLSDTMMKLSNLP